MARTLVARPPAEHSPPRGTVRGDGDLAPYAQGVQNRGRTSSPVVGLGLVVLAALLFVQNAGASRVVLRAGVDAASLTTLRVSGTFAVLLLLALVFRRDALRPPRGRLRPLLVVHGLIGVAALQWTYFVAIDRLPVGMALLLEYQAPILVALWARLVQREPVRPRIWAGLALDRKSTRLNSSH